MGWKDMGWELSEILERTYLVVISFRFYILLLEVEPYTNYLKNLRINVIYQISYLDSKLEYFITSGIPKAYNSKYFKTLWAINLISFHNFYLNFLELDYLTSYFYKHNSFKITLEVTWRAEYFFIHMYFLKLPSINIFYNNLPRLLISTDHEFLEKMW